MLRQVADHPIYYDYDEESTSLHSGQDHKCIVSTTISKRMWILNVDAACWLAPQQNHPSLHALQPVPYSISHSSSPNKWSVAPDTKLSFVSSSILISNFCLR